MLKIRVQGLLLPFLKQKSKQHKHPAELPAPKEPASPEKLLGQYLLAFYILMIVLFSLMAIVSTYAQTPAAGLQPGDPVPETFWQQSVQLSGDTGKPTPTTLAAYKGKLIILDFWATWCGSCVEALPKLQHLQEQFADSLLILPVTSQSKAAVATFLQKNPTGKTLKLPQITGDKQLAALFPHKLLSHLVWIDATDKVKAITWSEYATADNIRLALSSKPLPWTMKADVVSFQKEVPLLSPSRNGAPPPRTSYHSGFTSHLPGVNTTSGILTDSTQHTVRRYDINVRLTALCVRAWDQPLPALSPKQYIYEVADRSKYVRPRSVYRDRWDDENTWCYEALMPATFTKAQLARLLKEDLKRYLHVEGYAQKRLMTCLVITAGGKHPAPRRRKSQMGMQLSDMVWQLNHQDTTLPLALNETGGDRTLTGLHPGWQENQQSLQEALKEQGLTLSLQEREIDVFVIHELNP